jgi:hypothetical protein
LSPSFENRFPAGSPVPVTDLPRTRAVDMILRMSIQELEAEVKRLSPSELAIFSKWLEKFAGRLAQDKDHSAWSSFSAEGLARAYSHAEPEYTPADIKRR